MDLWALYSEYPNFNQKENETMYSVTTTHEKEFVTTKVVEERTDYRFVGSSVSNYPKLQVRQGDGAWYDYLKIRPEGIIRYDLPSHINVPKGLSGMAYVAR